MDPTDLAWVALAYAWSAVKAAVATYIFFGVVVVPPVAYAQERPNFPRMSLVRCLGTMVLWTTGGLVVTIVLFFPMLVAPQWARMRAHRCGRFLGTFLLFVISGSTKLQIVGEEHMPKGRPCIIAANHSSMIDVAFVYQLAGKNAWVAKSTVFLIPGVGSLMWIAGYIGVKRGNKASIKAMYEECRAKLAEGWSLVIFPQGTRNRGTTLPFKNGAFNIAIEQKVPVLPVSIDLPDDLWWNPNARRLMTVHPPIESAGKTVEELRKLTYAAVMSGLPGQPKPGSVLDCYADRENKKSK